MKMSCSERLELSFTEARKAEEHLKWERGIQINFHLEHGDLEVSVGHLREIPKRLMVIRDWISEETPKLER